MPEEALGQREIRVGTDFTSEELELLSTNEVSLNLLHCLLGIANRPMTLNTAISGAKDLLKAFNEGAEVADPRGLDAAPTPEVAEEIVIDAED